MEFIDGFKRNITLTNEAWSHIIETHPEMEGLLKELEKTLEDPELIKRSVYSENVILFYRYYEHICDGKHLCVVVKLDNKAIVTA